MIAVTAAALCYTQAARMLREPFRRCSGHAGSFSKPVWQSESAQIAISRFGTTWRAGWGTNGTLARQLNGESRRSDRTSISDKYKKAP